MPQLVIVDLRIDMTGLIKAHKRFIIRFAHDFKMQIVIGVQQRSTKHNMGKMSYTSINEHYIIQ